MERVAPVDGCVAQDGDDCYQGKGGDEMMGPFTGIGWGHCIEMG